MGTRLIGVTYGTVVIGRSQSSASYMLTGKYRLRQDYDRVDFTFEVVVRNATRATFLTDEAALLAEFRKPDQVLTIVLGASNRHVYSPTTNTGFLTRASARKLGGVEDTANSARYECQVTAQLPADLSGRSGRKDGAILQTVDPAGRRTVTVSGIYTAVGSDSALTLFTNNGATWAASVLPSGTFELIGRPEIQQDEQNKVVRFRLVYREVISNQASGTLDHPAIKDHSLVVRRQRKSTEQTSEIPAEALIGITIDFSCWVDKDVTTDLAGLYTGTIRARMLEAARSLAQLSALAVVEEHPSYEESANRIAAVVYAQGLPGGSVFQSRIEVTDSYDLGKVLVPVHVANPYARDLYDGPRRQVKVVRRTTVGLVGAVSDSDAAPQLQGFIEMSGSRNSRGYVIGIPGDSFELQAIERTWVFERADIENVADAVLNTGTTGNIRGGGGYKVDTGGA